ncbi:BNR-4 repeat-containing protein [Aeoliella sp.]|uniref:BNR-4 repeat-containing protein n=1 Tax=Aeoliella sp. TaxID=2795800 RepID=UPI003CCB91F4
MSVVRPLNLNEKTDGYRGIWYCIRQPHGGAKFKYSGGLGTYPAKHQEFAVYSPEANKTFFCFGGAAKDNQIHLLHMVSYYDHETGMVPKPTVLLDKHTSDAHDSPTISIDQQGFIWIFSPSHGRLRSSYIHRSVEPWSIDKFRVVYPHYKDDGRRRFVDNFSYAQIFNTAPGNFAFFFTRYGEGSARTSLYMTSKDGVTWSRRQRLATIERGHYQVAGVSSTKIATMMNYHPDETGLNGRTNLYYIESTDNGESWQAADGTPVKVPLLSSQNPALVKDYESQQRLVFLKDLVLDENDQPVLLYLTSNHPSHGPDGDPRTWTLAQFDDGQWQFSEITTSDHNYDMGSIDIRSTPWKLIAPTDPGPYPGFAGGDMVMWESDDRGATWRRVKSLTAGHGGNHTYCRLVSNAHPDFYALWADGDPTKISSSNLYFCNAQGDLFQLPAKMDSDFMQPEKIDVLAE